MLLSLMSVDPLAVLGIFSRTAIVFFYMNGGAQVSCGMGILILRTMQVYSSVNTTLGKPVISQRMQSVTRTLTIILLFVVYAPVSVVVCFISAQIQAPRFGKRVRCDHFSHKSCLA